MTTKLTLSLDDVIIKKAKDYATKNNISLSQVVENYLAVLTVKENEPEEISSLVKGLSGILDLPSNFDFKKDRIKHLQEKYK